MDLHALILLTLFGIFPLAKAEDDCGNVASLPQDQQCTFYMENCDEDSLIPYGKFYYCSVSSAGMFGRFLYMVGLMILLPLLFNLLADTAELYFSPTMAMLSQTIPKMRPRFAGVTFVAMGNGAPDLSANISAIRSGSILLSAGALTGAAMFVQCVVASEVIRISDGVKCGGATLRDVGIYGVSILGVLLTFWSGTVTRWFIAGAIFVYVTYIVWVFCGDEWHARGRPQPDIDLSWRTIKDALAQARGLPADEDEFDDSEERMLPWATVDVSAKVDKTQGQELVQEDRPLLQHVEEQGRLDNDSHAHPHRTGFVGAKLYQQAVWADLGNEPSIVSENVGRGRLARAHETHSSYLPPSIVEGEHELSSASRMMVASPEADLAEDVLMPFSTTDLEASAPSPSALRDTSQHNQIAKDVASRRDVQKASHVSGRHRSHELWLPDGGINCEYIWESIQKEVTIGAAKEWGELSPMRRRWRALTFPVLLPLYILLRFTVPYIDPEGYSQPWLVVTMFFAPVFTTAYFGFTSFLALGPSLFVGLVAAVFVHIITKDEEELPALDLGTSFSFGPAVFSLLGFFMGVLWIDALASEVVGVLTLLAGLLGVPSSLVGLTLLAWGGSLGDLFGNTALARRGHASTALTACFAGPLFILLISLSLGFSSLFAREGVTSADITLTPDVAVGCLFLVTYNIILATVGWFNRWKIPQQFFYFARVWYAVYITLACALGVAELWM